MLNNRALGAIAIVILTVIWTAALATTAAHALPPTQVSVVDFGARGDKVTDDTAAFQAALDAVKDQGGTVSVPVGNYLIKTHLNVPSNVTLEGVWKIPTAFRAWSGSTLFAVEGEGSEEGTPFITLNTNSTIKGIAVFYPNQKIDDIRKYPWCVANTHADNASIVDCLLINPYQGVDFGTNPSGRHYIRNLYGQPLRRGLFVDKCLDVGRIENVHFWPFWYWINEKTPMAKWLVENGEAFIFGRADWEYVFNTFCFGYGVGYRFIQTKDGATNGNFLGIGADAANRSIVIEATQPYGLLITNGEFVAFQGDNPVEVDVTKTFDGVVNFSNCAFWGSTDNNARITGSGTVSFNGCNFVNWDMHRRYDPCIKAYGGNLIVTGCNFKDTSPQAALLGRTASAVITGNRAAGPKGIINSANANIQVGLNVFAAPPPRPREQPGSIVIDDSDISSVAYRGDWFATANAPHQHYGYYLGTRWARKGTGDAAAVFTPDVPKAGRYTVYVYSGPDPQHDHASNAPVTIRSADGERTIRVDLRVTKGQWVKLGVFRFAAGRKGTVSFSNNANGNVLADAIKLVPVR
jgi:hypothetical protein